MSARLTTSFAGAGRRDQRIIPIIVAGDVHCTLAGGARRNTRGHVAEGELHAFIVVVHRVQGGVNLKVFSLSPPAKNTLDGAPG